MINRDCQQQLTRFKEMLPSRGVHELKSNKKIREESESYSVAAGGPSLLRLL